MIKNNIKIEESIKKNEYVSNIKRNMFFAFMVGGLICGIGEIISSMYKINFNDEVSSNFTIVTLIIISVILTGFGVYDKIAQIGGAGSLVPITGFANSMSSSAIEGKSEGLVLGIATNVFKLAGCVIVFGIVSAAVFGSIRYFLGL